MKKTVGLYNIGSNKCFGNISNTPSDEKKLFKPYNPHAVAKTSAQKLLTNYPASYNLYASTAILFDHKLTLRPKRFITQKIFKLQSELRQKVKNVLYLADLIPSATVLCVRICQGDVVYL
ncbi:GDPmannose 4,6-dehydratase [Nitrosomonas sp. Nm34]|nr:GDPmannose 4,6-dehydratase [Nitrosomonas sp. Nm34]